MNANIQDISSLNGLSEIQRVCALNFAQIALAINGKLVWGENLFTTTPTALRVTQANQVVSVPHNLPYVPANYLIVYQDTGAMVFSANQSQYQWTKNFAYFTASAAVSARVILF